MVVLGLPKVSGVGGKYSLISLSENVERVKQAGACKNCLPQRDTCAPLSMGERRDYLQSISGVDNLSSFNLNVNSN